MDAHFPLAEQVLSVPSSDPTPGGVIWGIVLLAAFIAAGIGYNTFKENGFRPRNVTTRLSASQLREIFRRTVAGSGWSIMDEGNPMIAQSGLLAGIRQQITLQVDEYEGTTRARIAVARYSKKVLGGATKAYTLRWRMNAFLGEVQRADHSASVAG
ncbi:MAG: hypothetical protein ABIQ18_36930 [Umezawaea sp.]